MKKELEKLYVNGQTIKAKLKESNTSYEGSIFVTTNGDKVVLNENGDSKKLTEMTDIVRTGSLLFEEANTDVSTLITGVVDSLDTSKIKSDSDTKAVVDAGAKTIAATEEGKKSGQTEDEIKTTLGSQLALKKAENDSPTGGDVQKQQDILDKYKKTINESNVEVYPEPVGDMYDDELYQQVDAFVTELEDGYEDASEEPLAYYEVHDLATNYPTVDNHSEETYYDFNDISGFLDNLSSMYKPQIDLDVRGEALDDFCSNYSVDNIDSFYDIALSKYGLTSAQAEELALEATMLDINSEDLSQDIVMCEIENDFEDTINTYEGEEDGLLDYLVDEYQISIEDAVDAFDMSQGVLIECISNLMKVVYKRLAE